MNLENNYQGIGERKDSDETNNLALNQVINPETHENNQHELAKDILPMKPLQDLLTNSNNPISTIVPENAKYPEGPIASPKYPEGPIAPPRKPVWSGELVYKDPLKEQEEKSS